MESHELEELPARRPRRTLVVAITAIVVATAAVGVFIGVRSSETTSRHVAARDAATVATTPVDPDAARAEITAAYRTWILRDGAISSVAASLEDPSVVGTDANGATASKVQSVDVSDIEFLSADRARLQLAVTLSAAPPESPQSPTTLGGALARRVDGHWKVARVTTCALLALGAQTGMGPATNGCPIRGENVRTLAGPPSTSDLDDPNAGTATPIQPEPSSAPVPSTVGFDAKIDNGDGTYWLDNSDADHAIVRLDGTGKELARVAIGGYPVALGESDGAIFVVACDPCRLLRVDPSTARVTATLGLVDARPGSVMVPAALHRGGGPAPIAAAPGRIWFALPSITDSASQLFAVDTTTNSILARVDLSDLANGWVDTRTVGDRIWVVGNNGLHHEVSVYDANTARLISTTSLNDFDLRFSTSDQTVGTSQWLVASPDRANATSAAYPTAMYDLGPNAGVLIDGSTGQVLRTILAPAFATLLPQSPRIVEIGTGATDYHGMKTPTTPGDYITLQQMARVTLPE